MSKKAQSTASKKKARKKGYSQDEINQMLKDAEERGAQTREEELRQEEVETEFENTSLGGSQVFGSEELEETEPPEEFEEDIFVYVDREYAKKGHMVIYKIKKDGQFMGDLFHPQSLASLQKMYGGGNYQIQARNSDGDYIKQKTEIIHATPESEKPAQPQQIIQPPAPTISPDTMLNFVKDAFEAANRKEDKDEKDDRRSHDSMLTSFTTMMQSQQKDTMTMFMEMQKSSQEMYSRMQDSTSKIIEKMNDKMDRQVEALSKGKDDKIGPLELIKMMKESEDAGKETMRLLFELVEAKAEERAESSAGESDSGMSKLVTAIVPMIQMASQQQQQNGMVHPIPAQPQQLPRRPVQAPGRPVNQRQRPVQPRTRVNPDQSQHSQTPRNQEVKPGNRGNSQETLSVSGLSSIMKENKPINAEVVELRPKEREVKSSKENEGPRDLETIMAAASDEQRAIAQIAIQKILTVLDQNPADAATIVLNELEQNKWPQDKVLEHFTFEFLWDIAKAFEVEDERKIWFEEFYANFKTPTGMVNESEASTESL